MRRAKSKVEIAYYQGVRVGISQAIASFYEQNDFNQNTFNMAASMRKEFKIAQNRENQLIYNYYKSLNNHNLNQEEN